MKLNFVKNDFFQVDSLDSIDSNSTSPISVIYQIGYLTIKGFNTRFKTYTLGFPNEEVEEGFMDYLLPYYTGIDEAESAFCIEQFVTDVEDGKIEQFLNRLKSLFADTPYELIKNLENHYQNVIWLVAKLVNFYVRAEYHTSQGRIDMVLQTLKYCYVMDLSLMEQPKTAL